MGSIIHPVGDLARDACSKRDYRTALSELTLALETEPANADLVCELAIQRMYQGREAEALELAPLASMGFRARELFQNLTDHYYCRMLREPQDYESASKIDLLRAFGVEPSPFAGVKLTACLIAKNEEMNLDRCLTSIKGIVDEIVVVDTGSNDRTVEIAKAHGAIIDTFLWSDDFAAARNHALDLATGNWILWIDADEELTPESKGPIGRALIRPHFGGFDIEITNFLDHNQGVDEFVHCPTRLFQNRPEIKFTGRIHEQITPSLVNLSLPWARLEGARILHHGYLKAEMARQNKLGRSVEMLEREILDNAEDAFQWYNLANAYLVGGKFEDALEAATRAVQYLRPEQPFATLAYQALAQAATHVGRYAEAIAACDRAEEIGLGGILISFEKCHALLQAARPSEALEESDRLMTFDWPAGSAGDRGIYTHKRKVLRAQILTVLGRVQEALELLDEALEVDPHWAPAIYSKGAILERLGRLREALAAFSTAAEDEDAFVLAMKGCGRTLASVGRSEEAADAFRQAWERMPNDVEAWIAWTGACEASGNVRSVLEAYEAFAKVHDPSASVYINWGRALEAAGEYKRALGCFTEAIKRDPEAANAYFNCGDLMYKVGSASDAAQLYEAGLSLSPKNAEGWFTFGNALAKCGNAYRAAEAYRETLALKPGHHGALHNLSVVKEWVEEERRAA